MHYYFFVLQFPLVTCKVNTSQIISFSFLSFFGFPKAWRFNYKQKAHKIYVELKMHKRFTFIRATLHKVCADKATTITASKHISYPQAVYWNIYSVSQSYQTSRRKATLPISLRSTSLMILWSSIEPHHIWFLLRFAIKCVTYLCLRDCAEEKSFSRRRHISYSHSRAVSLGNLSSQFI